MTDNSKRHAELLDWVASCGPFDLADTLRDILNLHAPAPLAPQFCAECNGSPGEGPVPWPCRTVRLIAQRADDDPWFFPDAGPEAKPLQCEKIYAVFEDGPPGPSLWMVDGMAWPKDYQWVVFDEPTRHIHKCVWNHVGDGHYRLAEVEDLGPAVPHPATGGYSD